MEGLAVKRGFLGIEQLDPRTDHVRPDPDRTRIALALALRGGQHRQLRRIGGQFEKPTGVIERLRIELGEPALREGEITHNLVTGTARPRLLRLQTHLRPKTAHRGHPRLHRREVQRRHHRRQHDRRLHEATRKSHRAEIRPGLRKTRLENRAIRQLVDTGLDRQPLDGLRLGTHAVLIGPFAQHDREARRIPLHNPQRVGIGALLRPRQRNHRILHGAAEVDAQRLADIGRRDRDPARHTGRNRRTAARPRSAPAGARTTATRAGSAPAGACAAATRAASATTSARTTAATARPIRATGRAGIDPDPTLVIDIEIGPACIRHDIRHRTGTRCGRPFRRLALRKPACRRIIKIKRRLQIRACGFRRQGPGRHPDTRCHQRRATALDDIDERGNVGRVRRHDGGLTGTVHPETARRGIPIGLVSQFRSHQQIRLRGAEQPRDETGVGFGLRQFDRPADHRTRNPVHRPGLGKLRA